MTRPPVRDRPGSAPKRWTLRPVVRADRDDWIALRHRLWTDEEPWALNDYPDELFAAPDPGGRTMGTLPGEAWIARGAEDEPIGFLEATMRPVADGCRSHPVGYLEGWFVVPGYRRQGVGAALVRAAESWARSRGASEMASDALLANRQSYRAHRALGYEEVERGIRFRRDLGPPGGPPKG